MNEDGEGGSQDLTATATPNLLGQEKPKDKRLGRQRIMEKWLRIEYAQWFTRMLSHRDEFEKSWMFTGTFKNYKHSDGSVGPPSFTKARGRADWLANYLRGKSMRSLVTVELGSLPHVNKIWFEDGKEYALPGDVGRYHVHCVFTGNPYVFDTLLPYEGLEWDIDGELFNLWRKLGWSDLKEVDSDAAVNYCTKYVLKSDSWRYWTI